ncbi:hypothetical protein CTM70_03190 [Photobacterium phosphoreum]|nr:hypothetical protein CTM70_03190 [Photobacterium phosphoreum]
MHKNKHIITPRPKLHKLLIIKELKCVQFFELFTPQAIGSGVLLPAKISQQPNTSHSAANKTLKLKLKLKLKLGNQSSILLCRLVLFFFLLKVQLK